MQRYTKKRYRTHVLVLMSVYVPLMFLEWPYVRHASNLPWKIVLALVPVVPVVLVIWLMAKRVMHSDELEQRLHLMALSIATATICSLCLIGGFLAAAGAIVLDGDVLIWVAPALSFLYGITHHWLGRRYGGTACS
jgi:hypothetical protein